MNEREKMLEYLKTMTNTERLKIIGVLTEHPATAEELRSELNLPLKDVFNHLSYMEHSGIIQKENATYLIDKDGIEKISREQFQGKPREAYQPVPGKDERAEKVLAAYLNPDGSIKQIPHPPAKLRVILDYLVASFTPGVIYSEREVNTIIKRFNEDVAGLRRDMVDAGLLARESDGSKYWRVT